MRIDLTETILLNGQSINEKTWRSPMHERRQNVPFPEASTDMKSSRTLQQLEVIAASDDPNDQDRWQRICAIANGEDEMDEERGDGRGPEDSGGRVEDAGDGDGSIGNPSSKYKARRNMTPEQRRSRAFARAILTEDSRSTEVGRSRLMREQNDTFLNRIRNRR